MGPVTPAMQRGWAPKTEKVKAAMKEDRRTSDTPYCWVVSMRSKEKAMPGSTLEAIYALSQATTWLENGTRFAKNMRTIAGMTL